MTTLRDLTKISCLTLLAGCAFAGLITPSRGAENCSAVQANSNVVEISWDGQRRAGSGVLLTFDGYIVTAAHLLLEGLAPPHPIGVFARLGSSGWQSASVKRIDPTLDLALLKLVRPPEKFFPLRAADANEFIGGNTHPICISGFGIYKDQFGRQVNRSFTSIEAATQGYQLGYLFASMPVQDGFSGGGAFIDGQFAGLILRRSDAGSFIIPVSYIVDFITSQGIFLNADRSFVPGTQWSQMPQLVENNRRNNDANRREINKILRSVHWLIELRRQGAEVMSIVFTPKLAFPEQVVEGTFIGELKPYFDDDGFRTFIQGNTPQSFEIGNQVSSTGVIEIPDIATKIQLIRAKYRVMGIDLQNARLTKFEIKGSIHFQDFKGGEIRKELELTR